MSRAMLPLTLVMLLSTGCASILSGTTQEIAVNTNPPAAQCEADRLDAKIGEIASTPGSILVQKTKSDITVVCRKFGYQQASYLNHSGTADSTFGNIVAGGLIGLAVDSASGAINKYDPVVNVTLTPTANVPKPPQPMAENSGLPTS